MPQSERVAGGDDGQEEGGLRVRTKPAQTNSLSGQAPNVATASKNASSSVPSSHDGDRLGTVHLPRWAGRVSGASAPPHWKPVVPLSASSSSTPARNAAAKSAQSRQQSKGT
eukprot:CAMPEP_0179480758 /NCGR_PEP_ID=MMETSP0799-20121207/58648_1 /TAXON_ID=46947 /ORGANISM="Geminigera cryophila, Strain CCMP2564" /LENGTH=111 /DNA_ID=CAMNT_0021293009 /DNA_START=93 /DNA_END=425 /DNA_ORIENTATION=+